MRRVDFCDAEMDLQVAMMLVGGGVEGGLMMVQ